MKKTYQTIAAGGTFKPFRDRIVPVRNVPCPSCGSPAGEPCRKPDGTSVYTHRVRRRAAIREGL